MLFVRYDVFVCEMNSFAIVNSYYIVKNYKLYTRFLLPDLALYALTSFCILPGETWERPDYEAIHNIQFLFGCTRH